MWLKGNSGALLVKMYTVTMERVLGFLKKLKVEVHVSQQFYFRLSNLRKWILNIHTIQYKMNIHNNWGMEITQVFIDGWMDKENMVCINSKILRHEKEKIVLFAIGMNLEGIRLSKIRERQKSYNITYMWNL